jgi:hypothetical protein
LYTFYFSFVYRGCRANGAAPQRELSWLSRTLGALPASDRAMLLMHIPPGIDPSSTLMTHRLLVVPFWQERYATAFVRQMQSRHARISFAIAGHVHRDGFRLFGGVPMMIAPPISPVYDNNPTFLRLDVSPDGTLRDYQPYEYDAFTGRWLRQPSFDSTYGVTQFTAESLASIHDRLRGDTGLRGRWIDMYTAGADEGDRMGYAWRTYWCAQTAFGGAYVACAGLQRRVALLPIAGGVVAAAVLALLGFLAMRLARQRRKTRV